MPEIVDRVREFESQVAQLTAVWRTSLAVHDRLTSFGEQSSDFKVSVDGSALLHGIPPPRTVCGRKRLIPSRLGRLRAAVRIGTNDDLLGRDEAGIK